MASRVALAVAIYALATIVSIAIFRGRRIGLFIDGALLIALYYHLSTLRRTRGSTGY